MSHASVQCTKGSSATYELALLACAAALMEETARGTSNCPNRRNGDIEFQAQQYYLEYLRKLKNQILRLSTLSLFAKPLSQHGKRSLQKPLNAMKLLEYNTRCRYCEARWP